MRTSGLKVFELSEARRNTGLFTVHLLFLDEIAANLALTPELLYIHYPYLKPQGGSPTHDTSLMSNAWPSNIDVERSARFMPIALEGGSRRAFKT